LAANLVALVGIRRRATSAGADLLHHPSPCRAKVKKTLTCKHHPFHFRPEPIPDLQLALAVLVAILLSPFADRSNNHFWLSMTVRAGWGKQIS
jgi:hypothetical protein